MSGRRHADAVVVAADVVEGEALDAVAVVVVPGHVDAGDDVAAQKPEGEDGDAPAHEQRQLAEAGHRVGGGLAHGSESCQVDVDGLAGSDGFAGGDADCGGAGGFGDGAGGGFTGGDAGDPVLEGVVERGVGEADAFLEFALLGELGGAGDQRDALIVVELLAVGVDLPALGGRVGFLEHPPCATRRV